MKMIIKSSVFLMIAVLFIILLKKINFLDINALKIAFISHYNLILLIVVFQLLNILFMGFRYHYLVKNMDVNLKLKDTMIATLISNGIGQWLPGSLAFIELIRILFMLGINKHKSPNKEVLIDKVDLSELSLKSKLAAAALYDRIVGFFVMLLFGSASCLYLMIKSLEMNSNVVGSIILFLVSLSLLIIMFIMPLFSRSKIFRRFFSHLEALFVLTFKKDILNRFIRKIFQEINAIMDALALGSRKLVHFYLPLLFSTICFLCLALNVYVAALSLSLPIPFFPIFATVSLLALANILPIGFGGIGGVQLVAAVVLTVFNVAPNAAASAQLLQASINLLVISVISLLFICISFKQIKTIFKSNKV